MPYSFPYLIIPSYQQHQTRGLHPNESPGWDVDNKQNGVTPTQEPLLLVVARLSHIQTVSSSKVNGRHPIHFSPGKGELE